MMVALLTDLRRVFGADNPQTAKACKALGELYKDLGRIKDAGPLLEECVSIFTKAEGGDTQAQYQLGLAFAQGLQTPKDPAEAFAWLTLAADLLLLTAFVGALASRRVVWRGTPLIVRNGTAEVDG